MVPLPLFYHFLEHSKGLQGGSLEYFFLFISKVSLKLLSSAVSPFEALSGTSSSDPNGQRETSHR